MADDKPAPDPGGLRQRRPSHSDEQDGFKMESGLPFQAPRRTSAYEVDAHGRRIEAGSPVQESSRVEVDTLGRRVMSDTITSPGRPSGENAPPRVRFSVDLDDVPSRGTSSSLDATLSPQPDGFDTRRGSGARLEPVLSIDTHAANSLERPLASSSPGSRINPLNSISPARSPPDRSSPVSPIGARARGLSLRSTLFQRNMKDQTQSSTSIIEMQEAGPSRLTHQSPFQPGTRKSSTKLDGKLPTSVVSISDSTSISIPADEKKHKRLQGIAALPNYEDWIRRRSHRNVIVKTIRERYRRARKFVLRINEIPPSKDGRHIEVDAGRKEALIDERTGHKFVGNTIRSTRYTAWNFVPRQLFAQFSKLANFYFLCVSILQMIPGLSTTGTFTTIVPLLFFVCVSMAKEGYDDLRRYRLDKTENKRDASVLHAYRGSGEKGDEDAGPAAGPIHWASVNWKDIEVGDIVKLERDDSVPADLVLLHSSGTNGVAYVETMALDGETNLKTKQAAPAVAKRCVDIEAAATFKACFVVEDPNIDLYNFEGRVMVQEETFPLTNNEILYRGSVIRNTPEVYGLVIYSGEECKIRMNANKNPRIKAPSLQFVVNRIVIIIVIFVIVLATFNTVAYQLWADSKVGRSWYLKHAGVPFSHILTSFIIMFNTMIPLSLYVSLEIIKLAQMGLLNDVDMYDEASNTPFEARTSTINEELGQINYIFSDKTGTLTDNSMKFRKMSICGTSWVHDADLKDERTAQHLIHKKRSKGKGKASARGKLRVPESQVLSSFRSNEENTESPSDTRDVVWKSSARPTKSQPEMRTEELILYIQRKPYTLFAKKARLFLLSIALCHTCIPESNDEGIVDFQASSPDELALVKAAQELGYLMINRDAETLTLRSLPAGNDAEPLEEVFEILDVIEFSSKRKRMSVVVRFPDQRVCVFCKGADSIVMQRLKLATLANKKVVEIELRASQRKSMEAHIAIARKSEQLEHKGSMGRTSLTLGRSSIGALKRNSITGQKLQPLRNDIDGWLRERERDIDVSSLEDNTLYYSPRPSAQLNRPSAAYSEARSSMQIDDEDDLVDESLVTDDSAVVERCFQHINDFATEGLRTLLYGYRYLDEEEYRTWKKVYLEATTSLVNRQTMIESAGELIECNLELGGATAIEDKLQKGVPGAIDKLRRANIKMWMLTGDKRETAINIGHSCRLIKDYSTVSVLDHETGEVEQHIAAAILAINSGHIAHSVVVIDGQTLAMIEADKSFHSLFFDLAILADSVICCRASPSQKAGLVKAVRKKIGKAITLAIGDGANDIAMIQEAHVGIGITGKEGLQAARSSDYSIAQFRFLTKLLLVHGRWNYIRTCKYTLGTFWKEMLFYLTQALFQRWNGYTGTSLYEPWSLSMFNTLFTSLPVLFMGIFEKDLAAPTLLAVPELYIKGQRNGGFNFRIYFGWAFMAASEAMIVYFCMFGLFGQAIFTRDNGLFAMGDLTFSACVILISCKMQLIEMHNKSIMAAISFICSVGGWFLWNIVLSFTYHNNKLYNVKGGLFHRFGKNALWWFTLILIVLSCITFELGVASLRTALWPSDADTFQYLEKDLAIRKRFEEAAAFELHQGWDRGNKKSSIELQRKAEEAAKETAIQEVLRNRPDGLEVVDRGSRPANKSSMEAQELLRRGRGSAQGGPE